MSAFVLSPYSIIIEDKFSCEDVVYVQDINEIGVVDDLLYLDTSEVVLVLEMEDRMILASIDDPYIINLDYDNRI